MTSNFLDYDAYFSRYYTQCLKRIRARGTRILLKIGALFVYRVESPPSSPAAGPPHGTCVHSQSRFAKHMPVDQLSSPAPETVSYHQN
jgi:hypothetical protein